MTQNVHKFNSQIERINYYAQKVINSNDLYREIQKRYKYPLSYYLVMYSNNKLKRLRLPKINKSKRKRIKRLFLNPAFFVIEEIIDDILKDQFSNKEFFNQFVDIKNLNEGEQFYANKRDFEPIRHTDVYRRPYWKRTKTLIMESRECSRNI